jgi:hypothetical protein
LWLSFTIGCALVVSSAATSKAESASGTDDAREQTASPSSPAYRSVYLSLGLGGTGIGYAGRVQITGAYKRWFAAGLLGYTEEFEIFGATPAPSLLEAGALTGYHEDFGSLILSAGVGIAWISSVTRGAKLESVADGRWSDRYAEIANTGLGVPFAVQAIYHGGTFGIGAQLFGNYNADLPALGVAGTLHLGAF